MIDLFTPRIAFRPGCCVMTVLVADRDGDHVTVLPSGPEIWMHDVDPREVVRVYTNLGAKVKYA
jgi:hypothetical protein